MVLQLTFLSNRQAGKPLDTVLRQVKPCHWTDIKPATEARIQLQMEAALEADDPSTLVGKELKFSEDGFSWYKFVLVEICQEARILSMLSFCVFFVYEQFGQACVVAKFTVEPEKKRGPELQAWSLASGDHLGSLTFQWGDMTSQVFTLASQKMFDSRRSLGKLFSAEARQMLAEVDASLCLEGVCRVGANSP
eukprot:s3324_g8.t1